MDQQMIIDTIHERRAGIDMIAMPYAQATFYADPDALRGQEANAEAGGWEISGVRG